MSSHVARSVTTAFVPPAPRSALHALGRMAVPLLATLVVACRDDAPTSAPTAPSRTQAVVRADKGTASVPVTIPPAGGVSGQVLSRSHFVDDINVMFRVNQGQGTDVIHVNDPSDVVMVRITFQPGGSSGWHTHPGPAIISVAAGELTVVDGEDCAVHHYPAGTAFVDPGQGHVHVPINTSTGETVVYATYLGVPAGQGTSTPAQAPGCAR
jgi:quercetin dioxygenase-like cupin family protein